MRPMLKNYLSLIMVFCGVYLFAQKTNSVIKLSKNLEALYVDGNATRTYVDESNSLTIEDISKLPLDNFEWDKKLYNGQTNATYWIAFSVQDLNKVPRKWIFEILDSRHHEVTLFTPNHDGSFTKEQNGIKHHFKTRKYLHKNFVMDINIPNKVPQLFYLKIYTKVYGALVFKLHTNRMFSSYSLYEYFYLGLFYGILIIFSVYNFLLFISIKNKAYLFYVLYVFSWMWYTMMDDNMGFQFLWPNYPNFNPIGQHFAQPLLMIMFIIYARTFLEIPKKNKRQDYIIIGAGLLYVFYHFLSRVIEIPYLYHFLFISPFLIILWYSVRSYRSGFYPARFFIIGNSFIFLGYLLRLLKDEGMFNELLANHDTIMLLTNYSRNISLMIDIIVLSLALADRLRYFKRKEEKAKESYINQLEVNEKLKDKVNKELEDKVKERTAQLTEQSALLDNANHELRIQAEEIQRMNSILDKNNYELQKEVIKTKKERVLSPDMNFVEFSEIYPDNLSVLKYLDSLKSKNEFKCIKCSNQTYAPGAKKYSRKCKKCQNEESVTSHTFFHRCKLPLNKVLYIVYKVLKDKDSKNVTQISDEIELRRKTVSDYKGKIKGALDVLKKEKKEINLVNIILYFNS